MRYIAHSKDYDSVKISIDILVQQIKQLLGLLASHSRAPSFATSRLLPVKGTWGGSASFPQCLGPLYPRGDPGGVPALAALGWPSLSHFCSLESEPADGIVLFPCHSAFQIQLSWWERKNIKTTE